MKNETIYGSNNESECYSDIPLSLKDRINFIDDLDLFTPSINLLNEKNPENFYYYNLEKEDKNQKKFSKFQINLHHIQEVDSNLEYTSKDNSPLNINLDEKNSKKKENKNSVSLSLTKKTIAETFEFLNNDSPLNFMSQSNHLNYKQKTVHQSLKLVKGSKIKLIPYSELNKKPKGLYEKNKAILMKNNKSLFFDDNSELIENDRENVEFNQKYKKSQFFPYIRENNNKSTKFPKKKSQFKKSIEIMKEQDESQNILENSENVNPQINSDKMINNKFQETNWRNFLFNNFNKSDNKFSDTFEEDFSIKETIKNIKKKEIFNNNPEIDKKSKEKIEEKKPNLIKSRTKDKIKTNKISKNKIKKCVKKKISFVNGKKFRINPIKYSASSLNVFNNNTKKKINSDFFSKKKQRKLIIGNKKEKNNNMKQIYLKEKLNIFLKILCKKVKLKKIKVFNILKFIKRKTISEKKASIKKANNLSKKKFLNVNDIKKRTKMLINRIKTKKLDLVQGKKINLDEIKSLYKKRKIKSVTTPLNISSKETYFEKNFEWKEKNQKFKTLDFDQKIKFFNQKEIKNNSIKYKKSKSKIFSFGKKFINKKKINKSPELMNNFTNFKFGEIKNFTNQKVLEKKNNLNLDCSKKNFHFFTNDRNTDKFTNKILLEENQNLKLKKNESDEIKKKDQKKQKIKNESNKVIPKKKVKSNWTNFKIKTEGSNLSQDKLLNKDSTKIPQKKKTFRKLRNKNFSLLDKNNNKNIIQNISNFNICYYTKNVIINKKSNDGDNSNPKDPDHVIIQ